MHAKLLDEEAIFKVTSAIESADVRGDYLNQVCADNPAIFDRVARLLRVHDEEPSFLERAPGSLAATIDAAPIAERPGTMVGRYKLLPLLSG
jgi:hypothetical protein